MGSLTRKIAPVLVAPLIMMGMWMQPAGASGNQFAFDYVVNASTTLKKLNQTVTVPPGTFKGTIDFGTGALSGAINLPPATVQIKLAGIIPLVTVNVRMVPTKKVTGLVDFTSTPFTVTATATMNIRITSAYVGTLKMVNLVGTTCTTSKPLSVTMSGPANLGGPSTFSGTYTIPPLKTCGHLTPVLNQVVPGPGNTFTAVATPAS